MNKVIEAASKKYQGLVPLVYDVETMGLGEARPEDMQYAVYLKREADKVIADKDAEIANLKEQVQEERSAKVDYKISANDLSDGLKEASEEIRYHKYKRCLAMAKWCKAEQTYSAFAIYCTEHPESRWADKSVPVGSWFEFWKNREWRWLKFAKKIQTFLKNKDKEVENEST